MQSAVLRDRDWKESREGGEGDEGTGFEDGQITERLNYIGWPVAALSFFASYATFARPIPVPAAASPYFTRFSMKNSIMRSRFTEV